MISSGSELVIIYPDGYNHSYQPHELGPQPPITSSWNFQEAVNTHGKWPNLRDWCRTTTNILYKDWHPPATRINHRYRFSIIAQWIGLIDWRENLHRKPWFFPWNPGGFPPRGVGKVALFIKLCGMSPPQPVPKTGTGDLESTRCQ